jgi:hypothetical protein
VIAGEYVDYAELLEKEEGIAGCPRECRKSKNRFDKTRTQLCDECPKKRQADVFRTETLERWEQWDVQFDFDDMLAVLYNVIAFESLSREALSVKNNTLASIYRSEKTKSNLRAIDAARKSVSKK